MADRISKERRSWNMAQIHSKNTTPELLVRSALHRLGYRFRLHAKCLPGHPDIVLPKWKTAVFVHGCFWHRHRKCASAYTPKSNQTFWNQKFADNMTRDRRALLDLRRSGWRVLIVWECQTVDVERLADRLTKFFSK